MNNMYKFLLFIILSLTPLCFGVKTKNNEALQNKVNIRDTFSPYPIAGPQPGKPLAKFKPEASQSSGLHLVVPGLIGPAGIQFSNYAFASYLALMYSAATPAFFWLSFTARVDIMNEWFTAFNIGLIVFATILNFLIEYSLILCFIFSTVGAGIGYAGYLYPKYAFVVISAWGSYIFVNLLHVVIGATETTNYYGLGEYAWVIYITAVVVYFLYCIIESKFEADAQSFLSAFTCSYGFVAGLSFLLKYFFFVARSSFDVISFVQLPIQFRWDDPVSVVLFALLIVLTVFGYCFSKYRESSGDTSPGFGKGNKALVATVIPDSVYNRASEFADSAYTQLPHFSFNPSEAPKNSKGKINGRELESHEIDFHINLTETSAQEKKCYSIFRQNSVTSTDTEDDEPSNNATVESINDLLTSKQLYFEEMLCDDYSKFVV